MRPRPIDIISTTQAGDDVNESQIRFVQLDLTGVDVQSTGATLELSERAATLTAEGAAAFGTYPEGEAFDPVTVTLTSAADCVTAAAPSDSNDDEATSADASSPATWIWWVIALAVLIALVIALVLVVRARRRGDTSAPVE